MNVILLEDVKKVGQRGSVVDVADGYAQNVLLPRKLALPATRANFKNAEAQAASRAGKEATNVAMAKAMLGKLDGATVTLEAKAGETGTLFKSIHAANIVEAIGKEYGLSIPEPAILLDEPLKKTGDHAVPLALLGARATITLRVG